MRSEQGEPDTQATLQAAIANAIADEGGMVTKWFACVEGINADGERYLWRLSDSDSMPWDKIGLLEFALTQEQAAITRTDEDD